MLQFFSKWERAKADGWYLKCYHPEVNPTIWSVTPPKGHEAEGWAAKYELIDLGGLRIDIPHWFNDFYK